MFQEKKRSYNWAFIVYPDSCPVNFNQLCDYLSRNTYSFVISPLHSPDENSDEEYKPHYHILISYDTLKSGSQILEITSFLYSTLPFPVHSVIGMIRYFCHLDSPEKIQYSFDELYCHNFDVNEIFSKHENDYNALKSITSDLKMGFESVGHYIDYLISNKKLRELSYCVNRIMLIDKLLNYYNILN